MKQQLDYPYHPGRIDEVWDHQGEMHSHWQALLTRMNSMGPEKLADHQHKINRSRY